MLHKPFSSPFGFAAVATLSVALLGPAQATPSVISGVTAGGGPETDTARVQQASVDQPGNGALGGGLLEMLFSGDHGNAAPPEPARQRLASAQPGGLDVGRQLDPEFMRAEVDYTGAAPGTIVVDTSDKHLYFVQKGGRAIRYGIGVGRPGFEWSGKKTISRKAEWPAWTPPPEMLVRRPDLPRYMPGGPQNPLGARALYLGSSMYRIHGTNEPSTIGQNVSSGCIRMMNEDVTDLYARVHVGTRVEVR